MPAGSSGGYMSNRSILDLDGVEHVRYDPRTDTYNAMLNPETVDDVGATIARAVAAVADRNPSEIPAIATAVDPDSLASVFQFDQASDNRGRLIFAFLTHRVTLYSDGTLVLEPLSNVDPHADSSHE